MKLVDILAKELKAWPEGMGAAYSSGHLVRFCTELGTSHSNVLDIGLEPEDQASALVSRAEWQAAVDTLNAPKVVEWDGVGLPPTGLACEYRKTDAKYRQGFVAVKVLCYGKERCFLQHEASKNEFTEDLSSLEFRPIRTAEQVAAEERENGIQAIQDAYTYTVESYTHKILHSQAARLYDAGCRLQVRK